MDPFTFLINLLIGLGMGMVYALMGLGLSLIYGIMKIFNVAQGELYVLGGYMMFIFPEWFGVAMIPSLIIAMVIGFLVSYIVERVLIHEIHTGKIENPFRYAVIITIGLSMILRYSYIAIFGPWPVIPTQHFVPGVYNVGFLISGDRLFALGCATLIAMAVLLFLRKT